MGGGGGGAVGVPKSEKQIDKKSKRIFFFRIVPGTFGPFLVSPWDHFGIILHYFWLIFGCFTVIFGIFGDISVVLMQI